MNLKNVLAITKKELKTYLDSPASYIVLLIFLLLWQFFFFRDAFIIAEASLRNLMSYVPWFLLMLVPALTMGSVANEVSDGTIEYLLTHPLHIIELVLGKFVAAMLFVGFGLLFMVPIGLSFSAFGPIDWGVVAGQYLGALLLAGTFIALGIFISSLIANPIAALLLSVASSFALILIGMEFVTLSFPGVIADVLERLSVLTHFQSLSRGVLDLRSVWYFVSAIIIFLSLAYLQILRIRIGNRKPLLRTYTLGIGLFIGIAVLLNILGSRIPGRLDLTQDQAFSLSPATKDILSNLDDVVNIKLFATSELPAQLRPILRDTKDTLRDYQTYGNGKIKIEIADPGKDDEIAREANTYGVREVQFNVIGQEELQLKRGYLGLAVLYGGNTEIIPIINTSADLEYQLTSFIKKLTSSDQKQVAFLTGHGEKGIYTDYSAWTSELSKLYQVAPLDLTADDSTISSDVDVVVVAGPTEPISEQERQKLADYFKRGGGLMLMLEGASVDESSLTASTNDNSLTDFITQFGVTLGQDIVYDLRSNKVVSFSDPTGMGYVSNYQFWPVVMASNESTSPLIKQIRSLTLPWASSLTVNTQMVEQQGLTADTLFTTTQFGGSQVGTYNIRPDQTSVPTDLSPQTVIVSLIGEGNGDNLPQMLISGDSDFVTDRFVQGNAENLAFGMEAVSWLGQEQSLSQLQLKQRQSRMLMFENDTQVSMVRYGNIALAMVVPLLIGLMRFIRRQSLRQMKYEL